MWVFDKTKKEYVPFDAEHTEKVFWDGEKGWAVKQKNGTVIHVTEEVFNKQLLRELDSDAYWKMRQIEDAAKGLSEAETAQVKKILKGLQGKKKHHHHDDDEDED